MLHNARCLPNLFAIMDGFVETRATIGNIIADETGQWPKKCDRMSVMYGEHDAFILPSRGLEQTVQIGQKFGGR